MDWSKNAERALEIAEIIYAVTLLEYHDMNWLSTNEKVRNERKQELLRELITKLK
jgi:hypothetical protein